MRNRKKHNAAVGEKINKLKKEKERLEIEFYAKSRALSDSQIYRDEETVMTYGRRLKEIEKRSADIDEEIKKLESELISL